jgi:UDP-N-acetyl-D-galactosamine dehydrogenase
MRLARDEYGVAVENELPEGPFQAVVLAVKHDAIAGLGKRAMQKLLVPEGLIYDIKSVLSPGESHARI